MSGMQSPATTTPLTFAVIGCGARARAYMELAMQQPELHRITAVADPVAARSGFIASLEQRGGVKSFEYGEELLAGPKLADVALISTQDRDHFGQARMALESGYDVLLEKPAAGSIEEVAELSRLASALNRKVILCFVLRYTPFYKKVKEVVDSGRLGEILDIQMVEGVEPWHFAHSFVRGHWAKSADSTPLMVAKCCHDTDIMSWLVGSRCTSLSSSGETGYFNLAHAPANAPQRCTDGCEHSQQCPYDARRYASDKREPWLPQIMPAPQEATAEEVLDWVAGHQWGRCVFRCDNDAPDHQNTSMTFESGVTASLLLTAFDAGRRINIRGTKAHLQGGLHIDGVPYKLCIRDHFTGDTDILSIDDGSGQSGYESHGGGDQGLVQTLYPTFKETGAIECRASLLKDSIEGHRIAFASEVARLTGQTVHLTQTSK
ncbi:MAG: Gfo/Idh/MocA family oxidoreductase [Akkermansiaceae bacterium]|nr:Gfo/Idh/MocA family oxidoreductase [Akkermansiaceae bacterium]